MIGTKCSVEACSKPAWARQLCDAHYYRFRRYGDPQGGGAEYAQTGAPAEFLVKAASNGADECLLWPFARDRFGYGRVSINRKSLLAHRIVCEQVHGPAPEDRPEAAHVCGNGHGGCVNGRHLAWKDRRGNAEDMILHGRSQRGQKMHASRLDEACVREIWESPGLSKAKLAARFRVSSTTIASIRTGRSWRWLTSQWNQPATN